MCKDEMKRLRESKGERPETICESNRFVRCSQAKRRLWIWGREARERQGKRESERQTDRQTDREKGIDRGRESDGEC